MPIRDLMTRDVETITPATTIQDAARLMRDLDVGALPVVQDGRLCGLVTDRDLAVRALAEGQSAAMPVEIVMTESLLYCREDDSVDEVAAAMRERQVRRIPVVDADRHVIGIVSLADLARQGNDRQSGDTLQAISQPTDD